MAHEWASRRPWSVASTCRASSRWNRMNHGSRAKLSDTSVEQEVVVSLWYVTWVRPLHRVGSDRQEGKRRMRQPGTGIDRVGSCCSRSDAEASFPAQGVGASDPGLVASFLPEKMRCESRVKEQQGGNLFSVCGQWGPSAMRCKSDQSTRYEQVLQTSW